MANVEILHHDGIDRFVVFFIIKMTACWLFFMAKYKVFWHLGDVPSAMKSPLSPDWRTPRGPLYSSRPSVDSVMNSREMWLLKQGFMGGNQA